MQTEYMIQKARHTMMRRGQYAQLEGFDTALRLFSSGDDGFRAEAKVRKPSFWKRHKGKILAGAALAGLGGLAAQAGQEARKQGKEAADTSASLVTFVANSTEQGRYKEAVRAIQREVSYYENQPEMLTDVAIYNLSTAADILKSQIAEDAKPEDKVVLLPQAKALISKIKKFRPASTLEAYGAATKHALAQDYNYAKGKVDKLLTKAKEKFS